MLLTDLMLSINSKSESYCVIEQHNNFDSFKICQNKLNCQNRSSGRKHKFRLLFPQDTMNVDHIRGEDYCSDLNKRQFDDFVGGIRHHRPHLHLG
jgi:hypothetical protein